MGRGAIKRLETQRVWRKVTIPIEVKLRFSNVDLESIPARHPLGQSLHQQHGDGLFVEIKTTISYVSRLKVYSELPKGTQTHPPSSPGWRGCWSCGWRKVRSSSGRGFEPWLPGATGGRLWRWCPSAADLGGRAQPWRNPLDRHAEAHHGNPPEARLEGGVKVRKFRKVWKKGNRASTEVQKGFQCVQCPTFTVALQKVTWQENSVML